MKLKQIGIFNMEEKSIEEKSMIDELVGIIKITEQYTEDQKEEIEGDVIAQFAHSLAMLTFIGENAFRIANADIETDRSF